MINSPSGVTFFFFSKKKVILFYYLTYIYDHSSLSANAACRWKWPGVRNAELQSGDKVIGLLMGSLAL
jgi:hypothetical protein